MIIKNAKIYGEELKDIQILEGKITQIANGLHDNEEIIDAQGLSVLPSFVDLNVNFKNDKFSLEHLDILEQECLKSGISSIVLRDKMDFEEENYTLFLDRLKQMKIDVFSSIRVLDSNKKLKNLSTLVNKGALGLELKSSSEANIVKLAMQYALMKNVPIFVECYNEGFDDGGVMNNSDISFELGLVGMNAISEYSEVAKMKQIAKFYNIEIIYDGLTLKNSLELLSEDDCILASIHHLIKSDEACLGFNTAAKIFPPLRSKEDRDFLKQVLKKNKIKFLTSLHNPKSISLKDLAFDEAAFGIHGLCDFISLCYTFFIKNGFLTWRELCKFTSKNPSEFLGLNSGIIEIGKEANLVIFDEDEENFTPKGSLYANDKLFGKVKMHMIKGEMF